MNIVYVYGENAETYSRELSRALQRNYLSSEIHADSRSTLGTDSLIRDVHRNLELGTVQICIVYNSQPLNNLPATQMTTVTNYLHTRLTQLCLSNMDHRRCIIAITSREIARVLELINYRTVWVY